VRLLALNIQHAAVRRVSLVANAVLDAAPDVVILSEFYLNLQGGLTGSSHKWTNDVVARSNLGVGAKAAHCPSTPDAAPTR
jgi:hypothetical protein